MLNASAASNRLRPAAHVSVPSVGYSDLAGPRHPRQDIAPSGAVGESVAVGWSAWTKSALMSKMRAYLDPAHSFEQARAANPALATDRARYPAKATRQMALEISRLRGRPMCSAFARPPLTCDGLTSPRYGPCGTNHGRNSCTSCPDAARFPNALRPQRIADPEGFPRVLDHLPCRRSCVLHKDGFLVPIVENLSGAPRPNLSETAVAYLTGLAC